MLGIGAFRQVAALLVSLLTTIAITSSCGTATPESAVAKDKSANDFVNSTSATAPECDDLVSDDLGISAVLDSAVLSGTDIVKWFESRTEDAPSTRELNRRYLSAVGPLTLCLVDASAMPYPHPGVVNPDGKADETAPPPGTTLAIEVIGLEDQPVLESVGPAAQVNDLWDRLPKP
jgi:hypothetical protein